jgi:DNA repair exonuclease SbcCD ATPase subunit
MKDINKLEVFECKSCGEIVQTTRGKMTIDLECTNPKCYGTMVVKKVESLEEERKKFKEFLQQTSDIDKRSYALIKEQTEKYEKTLKDIVDLEKGIEELQSFCYEQAEKIERLLKWNNELQAELIEKDEKIEELESRILKVHQKATEQVEKLEKKIERRTEFIKYLRARNKEMVNINGWHMKTNKHLKERIADVKDEMFEGKVIAELIYKWADKHRIHPDDFDSLFVPELLEKLEKDE